MKRLLLFSAILVWLGACSSLLEVEPSNNLSGDIFRNEEDIQNALNGAYYNLGGINDGGDGGELFGGDFIIIPSLLAVQNVFEMNWDDINGASYSDFVERDIQMINQRVESSWRRGYEVINTVNNILENIGNVENASARSRIQGEALAIRGILYFEMVRLWGPEYAPSVLETPVLPLLLEPVDVPGTSPPLNTLKEIYDQALADLTTASSLLEPFGANGTAISYYACEAFLMRLEMHRGQYSTSVDHANNIISSGLFSLASTPQEAFNNTMNSTEDVFAIQQTLANNAGNLNTGSGITNFYSSLTNQGLGALRIQQIFLNNLFGDFDHSPEFDSLDLRWGIDSLTATSTVDDINSGFYVNVLNTSTLSPSKYAAIDRVIPVIRYAEVLLSRAESLAFLSPAIVDPTALADYNAVRARAGLPVLDASDFTIGVQLYDSVLVERKREFLYEGHLFHDLKRRNGKIGRDSLNLPKFILPIPQSELDAGSN